MIELEHVSLTIKNIKILKDISFTVDKGEIVGFVGPNGSGKSMLMKCICGLNNRFTGSIIVDKKAIGRDVDFAPNTGFIIEKPTFLPYYSGYKNLALLAAVKGRIGEQEICDAMEKVGLNPKAKTPVKNYSLGMKQRLGLAQAIMEKPDILILDEPMNGLDAAGISDIRNMLLEGQKAGNTIILASHNPEDIKLLCNRVFTFENGSISGE